MSMWSSKKVCAPYNCVPDSTESSRIVYGIVTILFTFKQSGDSQTLIRHKLYTILPIYKCLHDRMV